MDLSVPINWMSPFVNRGVLEYLSIEVPTLFYKQPRPWSDAWSGFALFAYAPIMEHKTYDL